MSHTFQTVTEETDSFQAKVHNALLLTKKLEIIISKLLWQVWGNPCIIYHPCIKACVSDTTSMGYLLQYQISPLYQSLCIRYYKYWGPPVSHITPASKPVYQILQVWGNPCIKYHRSIKACSVSDTTSIGDPLVSHITHASKPVYQIRQVCMGYPLYLSPTQDSLCTI